MRRGFSLITAIFVIVLMASVAAFITNLSGKMVQETTAQYYREQSMLLAKSYTEFAVMAVTANDHTLPTCVNNITGAYSIYTVDVNISYIGDSTLNSACRTLSSSVTIPGDLNILVDVFVKYKDPDHPAGSSAPDIVYHRRSLQKI